MSTISKTLTAYLTTADSLPGADASITIFETEIERVNSTEIVLSQIEVETLSGFPLFAFENEGDGGYIPDDALAENGYERTTPWVNAGGQWISFNSRTDTSRTAVAWIRWTNCV